MRSQPSLPHTFDGPFFVGFAGRMGSGKTSAAEYVIRQYGFQYTRYSLVLQRWLSEPAADRNRLQKLGWDIMSGDLQAELNSRLVAGLDRSRSAAIDGLRHPVDFEALSDTFGKSFGLVFLEAPAAIRFARSGHRFADLAAFQDADAHPVEAHIDSLRERSHLVMRNEAPLGDLYHQLTVWFASRGIKEKT